ALSARRAGGRARCRTPAGPRRPSADTACARTSRRARNPPSRDDGSRSPARTPYCRARAPPRREREERQPRISSAPDSISTDSAISTKAVDVYAAVEHGEETAHAVLATKLE